MKPIDPEERLSGTKYEASYPLLMETYKRQALQGSTLFRDYTDHGPVHWAQVKRILGLMLAPVASKLDAHDWFVLLASIPHDIGMFLPPTEEDYRKAEKEGKDIREYIRAHHHEFFRSLFEQLILPITGLRISRDDIVTIIEVAEAHRVTNLVDATAGLAKLCALSRIADELDIGPGRADIQVFLTRLSEFQFEARWHWLKHYVTAEWNANHNVVYDEISRPVRITFSVRCNVPEKRFIEPFLAAVCAPIHQCLNREGVNEILQKELGILIEVKPDVKGSKTFPLLPIPNLNPIQIFEGKLSNESVRQGLRRAGASQDDLEWLNLYQPPLIYPKIREILQRKHLVIISGEPGIGKSLTGMYLAREFYEAGVVPQKPRLITSGTWSMLDDVCPSSVVYLDDPFGKVQAKPDLVKAGLKVLRRFLSNLQKGRPSGYVILTSREGIFQKVLRSAGDELKKALLEMALTINRTEYPFDIRKRLVHGYAEASSCAWLQLPESHSIIEKSSECLSLPLNVKHFCEETRGLQDAKTTIEAIELHALDPKERFLKQLRASSDGELLFALFAKYGSNIVPKRQLSRLFDQCIANMHVRGRWKALETKFRRWFIWHDSGWCQLSHPSVEEAVEEFLSVHTEAQSLINRALASLAELHDDPHAIRAAASNMPRVGHLLSPGNRSILQSYAREPSVAVRMALAQSLGPSLGRIPKNHETREVFETLLKQLLKDRDENVRALAAAAILNNVESCGATLENLATGLVNDKSNNVRRELAWAITLNFRHLSQESRQALNKLATDKDPWVRRTTVEAIADNFELLTTPYKELFIQLSKDSDPEVRRSAISGIDANFDDLPQKYQRVLINLVNDRSPVVVEWAIWAIQNKFPQLPEEFRMCLKRFANHGDPRVRKWVAEALGENLTHLSEEYIEVLQGLTDDPSSEVRLAANEFFQLPRRF